MSSHIHQVTTEDEFNRLKADKSKSALVVDFNAQWCGPCKQIKPKFEDLAKQYNSALHFAAIDIDNDDGISEGLHINSVPTFAIFKNGTLVDTVVGGDPIQLTAIVKKHAEQSPAPAPV